MTAGEPLRGCDSTLYPLLDSGDMFAHLSFQMLALTVCLDVWRNGTVCRKLDLDFSLGGGAIWLCRGCLVSSSYALSSSLAMIDRLMWGGAMPAEAYRYRTDVVLMHSVMMRQVSFRALSTSFV